MSPPSPHPRPALHYRSEYSLPQLNTGRWGVVLFGNLLADLAEINHASNQGEMEKLEMVQNVVDFMGEHDVAPALQVRNRVKNSMKNRKNVY